MELSRVGELSLAEHLQGARVTLAPGLPYQSARVALALG